MMRSNPGSTDLTELVKSRSSSSIINEEESIIMCLRDMFGLFHYICCYYPCSIIYKD